MHRTIKHIFKDKMVLTEIIAPSQNINANFPFTCREKIILKEGIMYIQSFTHSLFFLELTSYELTKNLDGRFVNQKNSFFLFMVLKGKMILFSKDNIPIISMEENTCNATYIRKGKFRFTLPEGNHLFLYISLKTDWLGLNHVQYPQIGQFLKNIKKNKRLFTYMPICTISNNLHKLLLQLLNLQHSYQIDFELFHLKLIKTIITEYQILLNGKYVQRVYLIKEYIDENYSAYLNNTELANHFFTTEKTLIKTFRQAFGTTPYNYLVSVRMEHAKALLIHEKLTPSQVYSKVGYFDFQSFRKQFKNYFGIPPSKCR